MSTAPVLTIIEDQDQVLLLAETIGELRERLQTMETEFAAQTAPIDAAGKVLDAALAGLKTLQSHILTQDIAALAAKLDGARTELGAKVSAEETARVIALDTLRAELTAAVEAVGAQLGTERVRLASVRKDDRLDLAECHGRLQALDSQFAQITEQLAATRQQLAVAPTSFNPVGEWTAGVTYSRLDVVTLIGSSFISLVDGNTSRPGKDKAKWMLLAARGVGGGGSNLVSASAQLVTAPATATDAGTAGQIAYSAGYLYVCIAANVWRRCALTTF